jgi:flagellum-specific peptidoglycan hydrolase FlgJ
MTRAEAIPLIAAAAVASEKATGLPAEFSAAQCALESGWLTSMPYGSCNCFGIKDTDRYPGAVYAFTKEWVDGKEQTLNLAFEKYPSLADCFTDHANLLTRGATCYRPHWDMFLRDGDLSDLVAGISAHYATGKGYAALIRKLMKDSNLFLAVAKARNEAL